MQSRAPSIRAVFRRSPRKPTPLVRSSMRANRRLTRKSHAPAASSSPPSALSSSELLQRSQWYGNQLREGTLRGSDVGAILDASSRRGMSAAAVQPLANALMGEKDWSQFWLGKSPRTSAHLDTRLGGVLAAPQCSPNPQWWSALVIAAAQKRKNAVLSFPHVVGTLQALVGAAPKATSSYAAMKLASSLRLAKMASKAKRTHDGSSDEVPSAAELDAYRDAAELVLANTTERWTHAMRAVSDFVATADDAGANVAAVLPMAAVCESLICAPNGQVPSTFVEWASTRRPQMEDDSGTKHLRAGDRLFWQLLADRESVLTVLKKAADLKDTKEVIVLLRVVASMLGQNEQEVRSELLKLLAGAVKDHAGFTALGDVLSKRNSRSQISFILSANGHAEELAGLGASFSAACATTTKAMNYGRVADVLAASLIAAGKPEQAAEVIGACLVACLRCGAPPSSLQTLLERTTQHFGAEIKSSPDPSRSSPHQSLANMALEAADQLQNAAKAAVLVQIFAEAGEKLLSDHSLRLSISVLNRNSKATDVTGAVKALLRLRLESVAESDTVDDLVTLARKVNASLPLRLIQEQVATHKMTPEDAVSLAKRNGKVSAKAVHAIADASGVAAEWRAGLAVVSMMLGSEPSEGEVGVTLPSLGPEALQRVLLALDRRHNPLAVAGREGAEASREHNNGVVEAVVQLRQNPKHRAGKKPDRSHPTKQSLIRQGSTHPVQLVHLRGFEGSPTPRSTTATTRKGKTDVPVGEATPPLTVGDGASPAGQQLPERSRRVVLGQAVALVSKSLWGLRQSPPNETTAASTSEQAVSPPTALPEIVAAVSTPEVATSQTELLRDCLMKGQWEAAFKVVTEAVGSHAASGGSSLEVSNSVTTRLTSMLADRATPGSGAAAAVFDAISAGKIRVRGTKGLSSLHFLHLLKASRRGHDWALSLRLHARQQATIPDTVTFEHVAAIIGSLIESGAPVDDVLVWVRREAHSLITTKVHKLEEGQQQAAAKASTSSAPKEGLHLVLEALLALSRRNAAQQKTISVSSTATQPWFQALGLLREELRGAGGPTAPQALKERLGNEFGLAYRIMNTESRWVEGVRLLQLQRALSIPQRTAGMSAAFVCVSKVAEHQDALAGVEAVGVALSWINSFGGSSEALTKAVSRGSFNVIHAMRHVGAPWADAVELCCRYPSTHGADAILRYPGMPVAAMLTFIKSVGLASSALPVRPTHATGHHLLTVVAPGALEDSARVGDVAELLLLGVRDAARHIGVSPDSSEISVESWTASVRRALAQSTYAGSAQLHSDLQEAFLHLALAACARHAENDVSLPLSTDEVRQLHSLLLSSTKTPAWMQHALRCRLE